jgi:8-oxo-dGTP pyrophosphatase MutT (NUDIX family)
LKREVAIAILHQHGKFLLQLREDIPGILYPGYWALFGGHLEPGETPDVAIRRELLEEIHYVPPVLTQFGCYEDHQVCRYVYQGALTAELRDLQLGEGWDFDLATPEEIRRGDRYSMRAQQVRPLGPPHRRILLDFIASQS